MVVPRENVASLDQLGRQVTLASQGLLAHPACQAPKDSVDLLAVLETQADQVPVDSLVHPALPVRQATKDRMVLLVLQDSRALLASGDQMAFLAFRDLVDHAALQEREDRLASLVHLGQQVPQVTLGHQDLMDLEGHLVMRVGLVNRDRLEVLAPRVIEEVLGH
jgi:hypothetical protein